MRWHPDVPPVQERLEPEVAYSLSCHAYGHEPACASYPAHLQRLRAERDAAGGEAALKQRCGFWERMR